MDTLIVIWVLWIQQNDAVFNRVFWTKEQVYHQIWLQLVDYGRNVWFRM
uniref:Uncharacterized protein n=1 Tax=Physcomitrium patens TaxID=3218 RepID=A0A2K1K671_PHYPA|nr:hypothetical protein PHYPA_011171 [Physcomitrium patens]